MRILHVVPYYSPSLGGMERVAQLLAEKQAASGHEVHVFTSQNCATRGSSKVASGVYIHRLFSVNMFGTPILPLLFFHLLRQPRNTIVHIHVGTAYTPEITALACKLRRIPYIAHFHLDIGPFNKFSKFAQWYKRAVFGSMFRSADAVVALAESHRKYLMNLYNVRKNNLYVIPNGVGEEYFVSPLNRNGKKILSVSRLCQQKNLTLSILAVAAMPESPQYHIVGTGEDYAELSQLMASQKKSQIQLVGRKEGAEKLLEFKKADIFLLTSTHEGQPLTILEAMAAGLAIVAADIDGVRETVSGIGILVKDQTPQAYANSLSYLMKNKKKREMLQNRARKAARKYEWNEISRKFISLYTSVMSKNN